MPVNEKLFTIDNQIQEVIQSFFDYKLPTFYEKDVDSFSTRRQVIDNDGKYIIVKIICSMYSTK